MNTFFIEFRDPLFSIIIFFTTIFIVTFSSYWWGKYKKQEDSKNLDDFLQQFKSLPLKNELKELIAQGGMSEKSWFLLAHLYFKNGDYEKSIEIYNELLNLKKSDNTNETMFLLGKTYFKAGFLERSKEIFLQILKRSPRTPQALHYLLLVYEYMRDYKSALNVLEPLDALEEDISTERVYLQVLEILSSKASPSVKIEKLLINYKHNHKLTYLIFEYIFRMDASLAWKHFDRSQSELLSDIFWLLETKDLNSDIIAKNGYLRELYSARGDVSLATESSIFEFNVLIKLQGKVKAILRFEYICESCKMVYPFAFSRCCSCHAIDTAKVEFNLVKDYYKDSSEENNSFQ